MSATGVEIGCQSLCQLPNGALVSANLLSGGRDLSSCIKVFNVDKNTVDANSSCLLGCGGQDCTIF